MLEALSLERDGRIGGFCVTARSSYLWFLRATEGSEENLQIQRQIIKGSKAYATLRADLKRGCVLPPLVLAARDVVLPQSLEEPNPNLPLENEREKLDELQEILVNIAPENIQIIDGLQRTNAIRQTATELEIPESEKFLSHKIRFEIWLNLPFNAIAYRMLLLNAGQKPMSMRHQVEILSLSLKEDLSTIAGIEIMTTADNRRRARPGQFQLSRLSQAFQAWLQSSPNVDISNTVMQELLADSAIETLGASLRDNGSDSFKSLMEWVVDVDTKLFEKNPIQETLTFFGNETVLQGFAAAAGFAERTASLSDKLWPSLNQLRTNINAEKEDPLGIAAFNKIRDGMNPSRRNVGVATRELVFNAFQQFFLSSGQVPIVDCWLLAGSASRA